MRFDILRNLLQPDGGVTPYWRRLYQVVRLVATKADTTTIRIILANASALWAVSSFFDPAAFDRPSYAVMAQLASQEIWAAAFVLHFFGVYWRIFERKARPVWALVINGYGFVLWFVSTLAINVAVGGFAPGTALEWILVCCSAWALWRTGLAPEIVTP